MIGGDDGTVADISLWPGAILVHGIRRSPVRVNSVWTWLTKPGTIIVFTFVPVTRTPWITSGWRA